MANYTLFGAADPTGLTVVDTTGVEGSCSTAFYQTGLSGFRIVGIRVFIPASSTIGTTGHIAHLWIGTGNTPDSLLTTANFSNMLAGQWNTVLFSAPVSFLANRFYWAQVYFPAGKFGVEAGKFSSGSSMASVDLGNIFAAGWTQVTSAQSAFVVGAAGTAPGTSGYLAYSSSWLGVDVLIDDGSGVTGPGASDHAGIADSVSILRTGLPATVAATASATDPLSAVGNDTAALPVGGSTATHTTRRGLFDYRVAWGAVTGVGFPQGPSFEAFSPRSFALTFTVLAPVRFVGCRIYKAPNLIGTNIPVTLWGYDGPGGAALEKGTEIVASWVADDGGWREIEFATPIDLDVGTIYKLSYLSPNGVHAQSNPVFSWFSDVVYPLHVAIGPAIEGVYGPGVTGGSAYHVGTAHVVPEIHNERNYYIEPIVEWDSTDPVFIPDTSESYYDQWVNGAPSKPFHFSVFFSDPEFLVEYAAMGITTLIAGAASPDYIAAVKAAGMDHYPFAGQRNGPSDLPTTMFAVAEDPVYAAHVKGYHIDDEPDLIAPYAPPSTTLQWHQAARYKDSTRPLLMGLSLAVGINQTFFHMPQGSNMDEANALWRQWADQPDILMGDFYTLSTSTDPIGRWGVWTYAKFTERLRMLNEGGTPIWVAVETTAQRPDQPIPGDVVKACWACLISGAQGIVFFDHRFADSYVTQDFAAMLHNPAMKAAVSAFIVRGNLLADALHSPEANLVTAHTSSNVTDGPYGGTYGVPMHFTTRDDGTNQYLFAMGLRPGATTATFTIPSWAGETVTVLDESRTVTVDGSGVLTDIFAANYTVHLYKL